MIPLANPLLASILVYPIKSCAGLELDEAEIDRWGLVHDRSWMVVDESGSFLTQRSYPHMARVKVSIEDGGIRVQVPGRSALRVERPESDRRVSVEIWDDQVDALDAGDRAAGWFSDVLGTPCRLVRKPSDFHRDLLANPNQRDASVGFADSHPILLVNRASVGALNEHLKHPIGPERFRPNFVIENTDPFAEDRWSELEIDGMGFDVVRSKPRCKVITVDQLEGEIVDTEPYQVLARTRRGEDGILFGRELVHHGTGSIRAGSPVEVEQERTQLSPGESPLEE